MQINISLEGEEMTPKQAAKQLHQLAEMVRTGLVHVDGFNIDALGAFSLDVDYGDVWPHGDYRDTEGNLLHVANDTVVRVTWANKDAETEEIEIPGTLWVKEHGALTPAGHDGNGVAPHEH
jgi:hypothetical protein